MHFENTPSDVLGAIVLTYQALKVNKDIAVAAMSELYTRKQNGDDFDLDKYIADNYDSLPKPTEISKIKEKLNETSKLISTELSDVWKNLAGIKF